MSRIVSPNAATNLMAVHRQWANRPDDERFLTPEDLLADACAAFERSSTAVVDIGQDEYCVVAQGDDGLLVETGSGLYAPTHHAFQQLAAEAHAPAPYLRELHPEIAAMNLNYSLHANGNRTAMQFLQEQDRGVLRAITSPGYGRIWDRDVIQTVMDWNDTQGGRWKVPSATYEARDPLLATTLYRGDRSMFVFLVNETEQIEVGLNAKGQPDLLSRGVIIFNSEVRDSMLGVLFFLYRYCCDNRIVWGAQDLQFVGVRHTSGAPERWRELVLPALAAVGGRSVREEESLILRAKNYVAGTTDEQVAAWLLTAGYGPRQAAEVMDFARREEGDARTVWQLVNGATARARAVPHAQERTDRERAASALLARA